MDSGWDRLAAWGVHLLTASGAVWGLLALGATADGRPRAALGWMFLALVVDSVDGTLARRLRVAERLPALDGALLDNVVDFLNYAVVPAFLLFRARLLPTGWGIGCAALICGVSTFQFAHRQAKTDDHLFRGFPSYWNVLVFYLLLLGWDPRVNLAVVLLLGALTLVPVYAVYPSRTPWLRPWTLALTAAWGASMLVLLLRFPDAPRWLVHASLGYVAYYAVLSGVLTVRRRTSRRS